MFSVTITGKMTCPTADAFTAVKKSTLAKEAVRIPKKQVPSKAKVRSKQKNDDNGGTNKEGHGVQGEDHGDNDNGTDDEEEEGPMHEEVEKLMLEEHAKHREERKEVQQ